MCGIAGIFSYKGGSVSRSEILAIRDSMSRRGPDSEGVWISQDKRVALGHRRLSIIDTSGTAAQPMSDEVSGRHIVYNGEIYNFKELRDELISEGHKFSSHSDTEVLLRLYDRSGPDMLRRLRGMYAFAIWDDRRQRMFVARDPFGIKPLYWANDGKTFRFASQVKALLRGGGVSAEPDPGGHVGFLLWGFVPEPQTMYRAIRALPAGCYMWVDAAGRDSQTQYFSVAGTIAAAEERMEGGTFALKGLRESFYDTVRAHLVADVPVGVFLSSGIDSGAIAAVASELQEGKIHTVTLGFKELRGTVADETPVAERISKTLGTKHVTSWISAKEFEKDLDEILDAMDQPSVDGVNTYFVSKAAKATGLKVALSGVGGDEIFGGYPGFRQIPKLVSLLGNFKKLPAFSRAFRTASAPLFKLATSPKYASLLEYGHSIPEAYLLRRGLFLPWETPEFLSPDFLDEGLSALRTSFALRQFSDKVKSDHFKLVSLEINWYLRSQLLRDADWAGMAHGLEIRTPFVDTVFFEKVLSCRGVDGALSKGDFVKAVLGDAAAGAVARPKQGFGVPMDKWISKVDAKKFSGRNVRGWARFVYERWKKRDLIVESRDSAARIGPKILIHRVGLLGDTIVALPAFKAIRDSYPDAHITLLYDKREGQVTSKDILSHTSLIDSYLPYTLGAGLFELFQLFLSIRRQGYSILIYLAPSGRSWWQFLRDRVLFYFMGIPRKVGTSYKIFRGIEKSAPLHERDFLLNVLKKYEIVPGDSTESVFKVPGDVGDLAALLLGRVASSLAGRAMVAFAPGSNMQSKKWPIDSFGILGERLIAEKDIFPVVFGGPSEKDVGDSLLARWGRGVNLAGKADVLGSFAALSKCDMYVGNDTGTMHLAAQAGVTCVALFSARDASWKWPPYGAGHIVIRKEMPCSGCMKERCELKNSCINLITIDEVFDACSKGLPKK